MNGSKRKSDQEGRQTYLVVADVVVRKERRLKLRKCKQSVVAGGRTD